MTKLLQSTQVERGAIQRNGHSVNRLFLQTRVANGIVVETEQLGAQYFTYYRRNGRIAALERYPNEQAAREGHLRWIRKDWQRKSPLEIIMEG